MQSHIPGFVPSDYALVYGALRALAAGNGARGNLFCEWGSGFGVVACLAAMLDFDACGIEIEGELVDAAQCLADDFGLPVEFARGNFIPPESAGCFNGCERFAWLTTPDEDAGEELELGPDDYDVIFAYPWPDEKQVIETVFHLHASLGAVLVTYHDDDQLRMQRKIRRKR